MYKYNLLLLFFGIMALTSCEEFLDVKPNKALVVPTTYSDLYSLLDNSLQVMDRTPGIGILSGDEIRITEAGWASITNPTERNSYIWNEVVFETPFVTDWNIPFEQVFYTNVVLEALEDFDDVSKASQDWKHIKGTAHFKRAFAYFELSQLFAQPYNPQADSPFGLPLREVAAVTNISPRSSVYETIAFIESDLETAIPLLPQQLLFRTRPTVNSARALLARVKLIKQEYLAASEYASSVINSSPGLLDYNLLDTLTINPFPIDGNPEMMYFATPISYLSIGTTSGVNTINEKFIENYSEGDLRPEAFFTLRPTGNISFTGNYTGINTLFSGISLSEVYLIAAESLAETGKSEEAWNYLKTLWENRFANGEIPEKPEDLLNAIRVEREKELLQRGTRWSDLRRYNFIPGYEVELIKTVGGDTFTLSKNSLKFTLPLPDIELERNGYPQNPR